jgi:3-oxoacyl-[acyl-carrier protein] reductase
VWSDADRCVLSPADITDVGAVQHTVESAVERLGRIDVLINNAGVTRDGVVWRTSDEDWDLVVATHLTSSFNFIRCVVPHMRSRSHGRIINVTSYSGMHGNVGQANYSAAKAGVLGLTKAVAKEVAGFGITVNAISPNAETEMVRGIPESKLAALVEQIPQRRFAAPHEMVPAFAFLASDEASYITGAVIPVDGGLSM